MNIFITGINYKTSPVEIREKLSFSEEEQVNALKALINKPAIKECVLLSTCNRTEVYVYSDDCNFDCEMVEKLLCDLKGISLYHYKKYFYFYSSMKAVKHLFNVACGLDSQVLGEDQILGQVKTAHELAMSQAVSGIVLNTLFREAITAAKKVKTFTSLSKNSVSVGSMAAEFILTKFNGQMNDKSAMIIGAGKIGAMTLNHLIEKGLNKVYVTTRTHGKINPLLKKTQNILWLDYNERYSVIDACDIVISSTTSPHYTITKDMLEKSVIEKKQKLFMDLAVPRDIDVSVKELNWVKYYNMDDLEINIDRNIDKRLLEVSKADDILNESIIEFERWYEFQNVLPVILEIQKYTDEMLQEKINQTLSKLKCASDEDKETVKNAMTGTVNSILDKFIYSMRKCDNKEDMETYFRCLKDVIDFS